MEAKVKQNQALQAMPTDEKLRLKRYENDKAMKKQLAMAIWQHKKLVRKATPFFSTVPIFVDEYAAFYETELTKKPELDDATKKFK